MASYLEVEVQSYPVAEGVGDLAKELGLERGSDCLAEKILEGASTEHLEVEEGGGHRERIVDQSVVIESAAVVGAYSFWAACWPLFLPEIVGLGQLGRCCEYSWVTADR